jgi:outer membrane murein-binding lipoprotein Lpp
MNEPTTSADDLIAEQRRLNQQLVSPVPVGDPQQAAQMARRLAELPALIRAAELAEARTRLAAKLQARTDAEAEHQRVKLTRAQHIQTVAPRIKELEAELEALHAQSMALYDAETKASWEAARAKQEADQAQRELDAIQSPPKKGGR